MTDIIKYLEGVKVKLGISSDRALAHKIGITQSAISNIMAGASIPSDETCIKIAELAGDDPALVILMAHKSKASEATKKHWAKIFKTVTAAALGFLVMISLAVPALAGQNPRIGGEYTLSDFFKRRRWTFSPALAALLLIVSLFAILPSSSKANDLDLHPDPHAWTKVDTALELTYQTLRYIDWKQTLYIGQHPKEYGEANQVLDGNMTHSNINRYMGFLAVTHVAVSYVLPKPYRSIWQAITIIEVGNAVQNNRKLGLAINLHF
jgi:transcriptional regulator with XRE-family HTH domain